MESFKDWICEQHAKAGQFYDKEFNLPYSFHLGKTVKVGKKFKHLLPPSNFYLDGSHMNNWYDIVEPALWGHDALEDLAVSYNDIAKRTNKDTAEIIRAVTNYGRGRNRQERMPDYIYEEIKTTPFALFVKLCDRIANVGYGKFMESDMNKLYAKEQAHFKAKLYTPGVLEPMWEYLDNLLKD